jgi:glutathione S-transferase
MFIPRKTDEQNRIPRPDHYVLYGWRQSYFTRKLQAALDFYSAPYEFVRKTADNQRELRLRSGTHQVPVLHTPENWMIADTTPLMMMLDQRFPRREMYPAGPAGVLVHVVEEYFDEWIARTTVHWRWAYEENRELLSMDAANGDAEIAAEIAAWGQRVCRATGVSSDVQKEAAEEEYHRILAAAEQQLTETAYLLGDRPTAVDCIVLAGLRAHFNFDPAPRRAIHDRYPRTIAWCEQEDDRWDGAGELQPFPASTPFARFILSEMTNSYQPFALANRHALKAGDKAFVIPMYGEDVSYLARPYVEHSRRMIVQRIDALLTDEERVLVLDWLQEVGLAEAFASG